MTDQYRADIELLEEIARLTQITQYVAITALDRYEHEIKRLEGFATGGTVNINGSSAVRSTASLQMIAIPTNTLGYEEWSNTEITNIENIFSINTRVRLEIGIKNPKAPAPFSNYSNIDIFWFPLGIYCLTAANISHNAQGLSLSLNLKDKMALLNGECGGVLQETIEHTPIWVDHIDENGKHFQTISYATMRAIIYTLLMEFGNLTEDEIVVTDIPNRIKQIVRWTPGADTNATLYYYTSKTGGKVFTLEEPTAEELAENTEVREFAYNDSIGYQYTDFIYPVETKKPLASSPGDTIVSVLDKVKNALGNFEYYFDTNGIFRFQEKRNFLNIGSDKADITQAIQENFFANTDNTKAVFSFADKSIVTAYTNTPQYQRIKNDIMMVGQKDKHILRYHMIFDNPRIPAGEEFKVKYYERIIAEATETTEAIKETNVAGKIVQRAVQATSGTGVVTVKSNNIKDYRTYVYYKAVNGEFITPYSKEILEEWPKVCDITKVQAGNPHTLTVTTDNTNAGLWWLEIVDPSTTTQTYPYLVSKIGYRPTTIKDNSINCLFAPQPPDIVVAKMNDTSQQTEAQLYGADFTQVPSTIFNNITQTLATNPAYDAMRAAVHDYMSYNESVTIQAAPIYWLEPNQRIYVKDKDANIDGDFMINSISIPLAPNGTMNINAVRAVERV